MRNGPKRIPIEIRFWEYVRKTRGCWKWVGAKRSKGYGAIGESGRGGGTRLAHRVSWTIHYGPIPNGMSVLHKCDNPECTNPKHLFLGTIKDNATDMKNKGRSTHGEKHPNARLTEAQVIRIRELSKTNMLQSEIAKVVGTTRKNVSQIATGHRWKRVGSPPIRRYKPQKRTAR